MAVEGPSGSGKSTLLQLLGALDRPTAGSVQFAGRALETMSDQELTELRRDDIGFVFQQFNLIPTLTAAENVEAALASTGLDQKRRRSRARRCWHRWGWRNAASTSRPGSRVASSSAWRSPAPSPTGRA